MKEFNLVSKYLPSGDQPKAIELISQGLKAGMKHQTILGATGTGKTFTMANIIKNLNLPTLIMSHNKTLAAQLFSEFRQFFPEDRVSYFVSYYDYYQPEAYVPSKDLYIEKDSSINESIERYRNKATQDLLSGQNNVVVVATVSAIYGIGNPEDYGALSFLLKKGESLKREKLYARLIDMQYARAIDDFKIGSYRVRGENVDIYVFTSEEVALRLEFFGDFLEEIKVIDPLTGEFIEKIDEYLLFPAKHYVSPSERVKEVLASIRIDLENEVKFFYDSGKIVEATRLKQRVEYDLEMLEETGFTKGIENYSRYIDRRSIGSAGACLLDYFPDNYLLFVDESHITIPQIGAMYSGDLARKLNLVNYGFRMKSALDNRPLKFEEFLSRISQAVYVSATPKSYELELSKKEALNLKISNFI